MARSTKSNKARLLNAAHLLLTRNAALSEAAHSLSREFDLSLRQAYRYLKQASELHDIVPAKRASISITLKLPQNTVHLLRSYAASTGLPLGEIVTRALEAFLSTLGGHG